MTNEVKSKQLGDLIQEIIHHEVGVITESDRDVIQGIIHHEVDVITESDWFVEQLDERIERYFEEKFKREEA